MENKTFGDNFKYGATIIVIVGSRSGGIGYDVCFKHKLYSDNNNCTIPVEEQWKVLEKMRKDQGGIIYESACYNSALRELLDPFIGDDGFIKEDGRKIVHTKEHGDFCVLLVQNKTREDIL